ncbi:MAG: calcium/sodium antiporter [Chloroflexi bacterium AL-W]|nr:calcium/sodium antiporter [Chloroflexi bacterium AL-N1]NOK67427.1 calcium/sodium antiporter [Chloroflexi bacterium AL-N10]NOK75081.1 calcium/sodium antiporter [Chloroflexi bacterium AL-N5]NOK81868.1 calcium/sodium antiporter [Chloroflexi bacterium AL-W]NOK89714.1 calcium/sodium antiporter [Chloroflexi bacterium AL-N15]
MSLMVLVLFVVGLVLLIVGAELLVRGASRLAQIVGISPLIVGLTVVAFGTSSPELAVSTQSALAGQADIALGNVVGSNIFNVLVILGACALIMPLVINQQLVRLDVPLMIGIAGLLWLLALDGRIGRLDGLLLFTGIIAYIVFAIRQSRRENAEVRAEYDQEFGTQTETGAKYLVIQVIYVVVGLVLLVLGARWLVDSAVSIAQVLGVSELMIGLTIVAAGTSMPEVATSIVATIRGERDIAVGNVIGSNIFNMLAILGITGLIAPIEVAPIALQVDIPIMIAVALMCFPIFFTGMQIARWEGGLFVGAYLLYTSYLILYASDNAALPLFTTIVGYGIVPFILLLLAVLGGRAWYVRHLKKEVSPK